MKARLVSYYRKLYLLCSDGTMEEADNEVLRKLFVGYGAVEHFRGKDGRWDAKTKFMEDYPGRTIAWVDDDNKLIIIENVFIPLVQSVVEEDYVTVQEYAAEHNTCESRVKVLCRDNRLPGAMKKAGRWHIPRLAPIPPDARFSGVEK